MRASPRVPSEGQASGGMSTDPIILHIPDTESRFLEDTDPLYASLPPGFTLTPQGSSTHRLDDPGPHPPHYRDNPPRQPINTRQTNNQSKYLFHEDRDDDASKKKPKPKAKSKAVVTTSQLTSKEHDVVYTLQPAPVYPRPLPQVALSVPLRGTHLVSGRPPSRSGESSRVQTHKVNSKKTLKIPKKNKKRTGVHYGYFVVAGVLVLLIVLCAIAALVLTKVS